MVSTVEFNRVTEKREDSVCVCGYIRYIHYCLTHLIIIWVHTDRTLNSVSRGLRNVPNSCCVCVISIIPHQLLFLCVM